MKSAIQQLPQGLDTAIAENGRNFSQGQRQLLSLCRAVLQKSRIILMDEATANIDTFTDQIIQNTLRKNFMHATVITIAHRLETVIDYDKILVMNAGQAVEYGRTRAICLGIPTGGSMVLSTELKSSVYTAQVHAESIVIIFYVIIYYCIVFHLNYDSILSTGIIYLELLDSLPASLQT